MDAKIRDLIDKLETAANAGYWDDVEAGAEMLAHEAKVLRLEREQKEGVAA